MFSLPRFGVTRLSRHCGDRVLLQFARARSDWLTERAKLPRMTLLPFGFLGGFLRCQPTNTCMLSRICRVQSKPIQALWVRCLHRMEENGARWPPRLWTEAGFLVAQPGIEPGTQAYETREMPFLHRAGSTHTTPQRSVNPIVKPPVAPPAPSPAPFLATARRSPGCNCQSPATKHHHHAPPEPPSARLASSRSFSTAQ